MVATKKLMIFLAIILTLICSNEAKKTAKKVYFIRNEVTFDTVYIQDHSLYIGPARASLNIILNIARNFSYDPWAEIILSAKNLKEIKYRPLFTYDINACNILGKEGTAFNNFLLGWINNFLKYGNLPKRCPIIKGNYSWLGLKADKLNIPQFLPGGQYRAVINTYFRRGSFTESIDNLTIDMELK